MSLVLMKVTTMRRNWISVAALWWAVMTVMTGLSFATTTTTTAFVTTTANTIKSRQNEATATRFIETKSWAKKVKRKTAPTSGGGNGVSGGGGFGRSATATQGTGSTTGTTSGNPGGTVIPFSGHSGSGTKALRKVANQFDTIRKEYGVSACRDVYVRSPLHSKTTFWFVGKIACIPMTTTTTTTATTTIMTDHGDNNNDDDDGVDDGAVDAPRFVQTSLLLKRIILEYSKDQLRPQAMGGKYAPALELWLAPADSEMDAATNKISLVSVRGSLSSLSTTASLAASDIGYNPEIYVGDERVKGGLRVERDENGVPTKPPFEPNLSQ